MSKIILGGMYLFLLFLIVLLCIIASGCSITKKIEDKKPVIVTYDSIGITFETIAQKVDLLYSTDQVHWLIDTTIMLPSAKIMRLEKGKFNRIRAYLDNKIFLSQIINLNNTNDIMRANGKQAEDNNNQLDFIQTEGTTIFGSESFYNSNTLRRNRMDGISIHEQHGKVSQGRGGP